MTDDDYTLSTEGEHAKQSLMEAAVIVSGYNDFVEENVGEEFILGDNAVFELGKVMHEKKMEERNMADLLGRFTDDL